MRKIIVIVSIIAVLVSCRAKKDFIAEENVSELRPLKEVIEGHYRNKKDFSTAYIKASARYRDNEQSHSVNAEIRIKKDETILISIRFLGITMAKALITPQRVSYYEKIGNKFFEGNYSLLSNWLGTDLDFYKVQNMLLGEAMDDLTASNYKIKIEEGKYKLTSKPENGTVKEFLFEGGNYLLKQQNLKQDRKNRSLFIDYPAHKEYTKAILPSEVKIEAHQENKISINIQYNSVTFDENLTFPYNVPEGFDQIFID